MKYFLMSCRFDKQSPNDFGLKYENGIFYSKKDNSIWNICNLYDFGVGRENGFYKEPLPKFENLIEILLKSDDKEDRYGAAAIIIYNFIDDLYLYLTSISKKQRLLFIKKTNEFLLFDRLNRFILPNSIYNFEMWKKILS